MNRQDLKLASLVAGAIVALGLLATTLSIFSMRHAYRQAREEIASSCRRVSLFTLDDARYFCAPVARLERNAGPERRVAPEAREGRSVAPPTHL